MNVHQGFHFTSSFLLDDAQHQKPLMRLAMDYVTQVAGNLHNTEIAYTFLTVSKNPRIAAEGRSPSDLVAEIKKADLIHRSDSKDSEGLYDGAAQVVNILDHSLGARIILIFSDNDDEVEGNELKNRKTQFASLHARCYPVLPANRGFYGSKVHAAAGFNLRALATFSGGAIYKTDWQD